MRSFGATWLPDGSSYLKLETPDECRLLGSRGADLIVYDLAGRRTIPLTNDGDPDTIDNGRATWSPDGKWIAYVRSDSSAVPKRAVLVPGDPTYRTFRETRYERIGGPIATLRIGVVGVEGGPTRWVELADKPGTFYLNQVSWAGNADELLIEKGEGLQRGLVYPLRPWRHSKLAVDSEK